MVVKSLMEGFLLEWADLATQIISFDLAFPSSWYQKCRMATGEHCPERGSSPIGCGGLRAHHC